MSSKGKTKKGIPRGNNKIQRLRNSEHYSAQFSKNMADSRRMLEVLQTEITQLDEEIKLIKGGRDTFEGQMFIHKRRKEDLRKIIATNEEWLGNYERDIGPFQENYRMLRITIDKLYKEAKQKHKNGLDYLIEHFDYHPAFMRWNDTFSAVPFKPK